MSLMPTGLSPDQPPRRHTEPHFVQLAALCWRKGKDGPEVLLVTSSSGRWILPKGWPIEGKSPAEAALTEAWEEGGVRRGKAGRKPVGSYMALKRTVQGDDLPCLHRVYAIKVRDLCRRLPRGASPRPRLGQPEEAARMVDEEGLRDILRSF
jgi:8-oxo-dGTP pyrophosphatase MutT (NUDIX family)